MAATHLTDDDRASLALQTLEFRLTPPCFTPNEACLDRVERGLLEVRKAEAGPERGRWYVRRTLLAERLLSCRGAA